MEIKQSKEVWKYSREFYNVSSIIQVGLIEKMKFHLHFKRYKEGREQCYVRKEYSRQGSMTAIFQEDQGGSVLGQTVRAERKENRKLGLCQAF